MLNMQREKLSTFEKELFITGAVSTMPILSIPLFGRDISIFRALFYLNIVLLFVGMVRSRRIVIRKKCGYIVIWLCIGVVSGVCGWLLLRNSDTAFSKVAFSYIPKVIAFLVFALLWGSQDSDRLKSGNEALITGLMIGCVLNAVWAIIDAAGYYLTHISINNLAFSGYIARNDIRYGELSLIVGGMIRSGGFNYDPAQLGFISPMLMGYGVIKKKKIYIFLSVGSIIASASTTALVCSIAIFLVAFQWNKNIRLPQRKSHRLLLLMVVTIMMFGMLIINWDKIVSLIRVALGNMASRIGNVYFSNEKPDIRWDYIRFAPRAFINLGFGMIMGNGFGTASYGYVIDPMITNEIGLYYHAYDPENTYICYLMDTGIIGLILYIYILIILMGFFKKRVQRFPKYGTNIMIYSGVLASIFSMFFYHYILFAPQMLLLVIGLCEMDTVRSIEEYDGMIDVFITS